MQSRSVSYRMLCLTKINAKPKINTWIHLAWHQTRFSSTPRASMDESVSLARLTQVVLPASHGNSSRATGSIHQPHWSGTAFASQYQQRCLTEACRQQAVFCDSRKCRSFASSLSVAAAQLSILTITEAVQVKQAGLAKLSFRPPRPGASPHDCPVARMKPN